VISTGSPDTTRSDDLIPMVGKNRLEARCCPGHPWAHTVGSRTGGAEVKVAERSGKWVEMDTSPEREGEIAIRVPNTIWAGWLEPVFLKESDLAGFLRSVGWDAVPPSEKHRR
jgi:hypothetical protein